MNKERKTIFLDRDGLINCKAEPHQYITKCDEFIFLPGVFEAVKALNEVGYRIIIVTNQRGVARGMLSMADVEDIHRFMCREMEKHGAHIDGIYVCPHDIGECSCRKPNIGLFLMAEQDFLIDKSASWMIGDSETDIQAGERYGVRSLLTDNLAHAVEIIFKKTEGR